MLLAFHFGETSQRLREMADVSPAQFEINIERHMQKFVREGAQYGLQFADIAEERGQYVAIRFNLSPGTTRQTLYAGLSFLQPLACTVELADIPALIQSPVMRATFQANWQKVHLALVRISPDEIFDKLNEIEMKLISTPETSEEQALTAMQRAGIKDPLEKFDAYDREQAELRRKREAAEDAAYRDFAPDMEEPQSEPFRETAGDW